MTDRPRSFRLNDTDYGLLREMARAHRTSISEMMRQLIRTATASYVPPVTISREEYDRLKALDTDQQESDVP